MSQTRAGWRPWLVVGSAAAAGFAAGGLGWRIAEAARLLRGSRPYQSSPADPMASMLVVGDSTGVGAGASLPERSVAGLLGTAYPRLRVVNRARNGAKWSEFAGQISAEAGEFDILLVMGGGNDVIRGTPVGRLQADALRAARTARQRARYVILLPPGNLGNAPFFWRPLSTWIDHRARRLHHAVREAAAATGTKYVDLYRPRRIDPFALRPGVLLSSDGLHPSDAGYRVWLRELQQQAGLDRLVASDCR